MFNWALGRCYRKDTVEVSVPLTTSVDAVGNGRVSMCLLMPGDVPHCGWAACILQGNSCPALTGTDKWYCSGER